MKKKWLAMMLPGFLVSAAACGGGQTNVVPASSFAIEGGRVLVFDSLTTSITHRGGFFSRDPDRTTAVRYRIRTVTFDASGSPVPGRFDTPVDRHPSAEGLVLEPKAWFKSGRLQLWDAGEIRKHWIEANRLCEAGSWRDSAVAPMQVMFYLCPDGSLYRFEDPDRQPTRLELGAAPHEIDRILAFPGRPGVVVVSGFRAWEQETPAKAFVELTPSLLAPGATLVGYGGDSTISMRDSDPGGNASFVVARRGQPPLEVRAPDPLSSIPLASLIVHPTPDLKSVFWFSSSDAGGTVFNVVDLASGEHKSFALVDEAALH